MDRGVHDLFFGRSGGVEFGHDAPQPRHQDTVRNAQDFRQIGRDHHDGLALVGQRPDLRMYLRNGADVDAARRLVEDDDRGILHQRLGDDHLLLVAAGELDDLRLALQRADLQPLHPIAGEPVPRHAREQEAPSCPGGELADIDVVVDHHGLEEAVQLAVLGDVGDAVVDRLFRYPVADRSAAQLDGAAIDQVTLQGAKDDLGDLGAAGANQAGDADDLAGIDRERHVLDHGPHGDVFHRQHLFAPLAPALGVAILVGIMGLRDVAADHVAHQLFPRHVSGPGRDHQLAVPQHGDAVGNLQTLLERVRDVDDGNAAGAQVADQVEEVDDLFRRQARRRLIEDDDTGVVVDGAGDLDHLPLGGAQQPDRRRRIDMEVQRLQQLLRLDVQLLEARDELLVAEFDVLRRRHGRHQAGLLVDHADAGSERIARPLEIDRLAVDVIFARCQLDGAGNGLAEGRFAGAVLAYQRMDFAAIEVEIDGFDGVHAAVNLVAADDPQHRLRGRRWRRGRWSPRRQRLAHAPPPERSSNTRPLPLDTITRPCAVSHAAVMP